MNNEEKVLGGNGVECPMSNDQCPMPNKIPCETQRSLPRLVGGEIPHPHSHTRLTIND